MPIRVLYIKTLDNTNYPELSRLDELIYKWVDDSYDMEKKINLAKELSKTNIPNSYKSEDLIGYRCVRLNESKLTMLMTDGYIDVKTGLPLVSFAYDIAGLHDFVSKDPNDKRYLIFKKKLSKNDICVNVQKWFNIFKNKYRGVFNKEPFKEEIEHMSKMINLECEIICYSNNHLTTVQENDILDNRDVVKRIF